MAKTYFAQFWVEIPGFSVVIHQFNLRHVNTVVARFENTLKLKMTGKSKTVKWKVLNGYGSYHHLIHDAVLYSKYILRFRGNWGTHHHGILYRATKLHIISQNRVNFTVTTVRTLNLTFKGWQWTICFAVQSYKDVCTLIANKYGIWTNRQVRDEVYTEFTCKTSETVCRQSLSPAI